MSFVPTAIPSARPQSKKDFRIENFLGVDMTNDAYNVDDARSPFALNMIRREKGTAFKRPGWKTVRKYPARINGVHFLYGIQNIKLVHAGTSLYIETDTTPTTVPAASAIYTTMNNIRSASKQMGGKLCLFDGKKYLIFNGTTVVPASQGAYIPTVIIASTATGGGELLEPVNLLTPWRKQTVLGDDTNKIFQLATTDLDADIVKILKDNASGGKDPLVEGTDFTVNRPLGKITFTAAHPPITPGIPNLEVTYAATKEGYADKINLCDIVTLYGVNGSRDRLFASGNPKEPNYDYYSQLNDPTYFGDLWYSVLGQDNSAIMGYSVVGDMLTVHKNRADDDTNAFLRSGTMIDGEAAFVAKGSLQGAGAINKYCFASLETEPVFLTKEGVFAITQADITGRDYAQLRSYRINKALLAEPNLEDAVSIVYDQFYMLSVNSKVYILDGSQFYFEKSYPFSTRQYEAYYWENVNARVWYEQDKVLCFGTSGGEIREFEDYSVLPGHKDDNTPVPFQWYSMRFTGNFATLKKFNRLYTTLAAFPITGARIWIIVSSDKRGAYKELIRDYDASAAWFDWIYLDWEFLTWSDDTTPQRLRDKFKAKTVINFQILIENDKDQPLGLYRLAAYYKEALK